MLGGVLKALPAVSGVSIVSAIKVSSRGNVKCAEEHDEEKREAKVYLFTCHLPPFPNTTEFHHWALVLYFEDGTDVRTVEGLVDEETQLYAVYTKEKPKEEGHYYFLETITISPKEVLHMCKSNSYNFNEYLPTAANCQSWVKELAANLGTGISSKLDKFRTLQEAHPIFAKVVKYSSTSSNFTSRPYQKSFNSSKAASGPKDKTY